MEKPADKEVDIKGGKPTAPPTGKIPDAYKGHAIGGSFDGNSFRVTATVPTGGFALDLQKFESKGNDTDVYVRLTTPGQGESVTDAISEHSVVTTIKTSGGEVRVHLQEYKRGAHYFVDPEFLHAFTIDH